MANGRSVFCTAAFLLLFCWRLTGNVLSIFIYFWVYVELVSSPLNIVSSVIRNKRISAIIEVVSRSINLKKNGSERIMKIFGIDFYVS